MTFWLGNLWASLVEWAWILLAIAAAASFLVSAFASLIPFLRSYGGAALIVGIVLAVASSNIQGRASSSAYARLVATQKQLADAERANARQALVILAKEEARRAADEAMVSLIDELQAADMEAENLKNRIADMETHDATVSEYLSRPLPPGLGRLLDQ